MNLDELDLTRSELYRNGFPHDVFTALREQAPVWQHPQTDGFEETGGEGFWVLSRYADIRDVNRAADQFLSAKGPGLGYEGTGLMLTDMDGQAHIRQRKLISSGFTPRMTRRLEDLAREWAVEIVEEALARETVEFVQDVAYQLPMHMIADILGIPKTDRDWLFKLTNDMLLCIDPEHPVPESERESLSTQIFAYGQKISAQKRKQPEDDVLSLLVTVEDDLGQLNPLELDAFFMLLTVAGSETTRNAISSGLQQLMKEPEQLEALRRDPSLQKNATEEIIRWSSPVAYFKRIVAEDTEIAGVPISAGERVTLWYPSGNRDETVFEDPFRFDIRRKPNEHMAFGGGGPHFCLGAHLARREISILFEELLKRTSDIELVGEPTYSVLGIGNPILMSLGSLPVHLKAA
ncbi:MAG: cytochrome P450 [Deltaproteobacteria bacterium]|jgi:cholest-4-en-3-one 26-monooxygenase|nr:cytochrome P450 [Deltaproteobacteria bacterium]MBW2496892.1 cytochrome P450 [Deltaproteobacteria bacterium]